MPAVNAARAATGCACGAAHSNQGPRSPLTSRKQKQQGATKYSVVTGLSFRPRDCGAESQGRRRGEQARRRRMHTAATAPGSAPWATPTPARPALSGPSPCSTCSRICTSTSRIDSEKMEVSWKATPTMLKFSSPAGGGCRARSSDQLQAGVKCVQECSGPAAAGAIQSGAPVGRRRQAQRSPPAGGRPPRPRGRTIRRDRHADGDQHHVGKGLGVVLVGAKQHAHREHGHGHERLRAVSSTAGRGTVDAR